MRRREANSKTNPLADLEEARRLLTNGPTTRAWLVLRRPKGEPARIDREHYRGPYDSLSEIQEWFITDEVAEALRAETEGQPHWGYTDEKRRRLPDVAWTDYYCEPPR